MYKNNITNHIGLTLDRTNCNWSMRCAYTSRRNGLRVEQYETACIHVSFSFLQFILEFWCGCRTIISAFLHLNPLGYLLVGQENIHYYHLRILVYVQDNNFETTGWITTLGNKKKKKSVYLDFAMWKCSEGSLEHPTWFVSPNICFNPGRWGVEITIFAIFDVSSLPCTRL